MKKAKFIIVILAIILSTTCALSVPKFADSKRIPPDPVYKNTILIPQGYNMNVSLGKDIKCENITPPEDIIVTLNDDFIYKGNIVAPSGSLITGKFVKKNYDNNSCKLKARFTNIITLDGKNIPISAVFANAGKNGYINSLPNNSLFENNNADIILKQPITYILQK